MIWRALALALVAVLSGIVPAAAGQGTFYHQDVAAFGPPLADSVLNDVRGGFLGMAFSVFFSLWAVNSGSDTAGTLAVTTSPVDTSGGLTTSSATSGDQPQLRVAAIAGTAFNGANGFFKVTQVSGNNNHVVSNLFVQLVVVNAPSTASLPSFMNLLR